MSHTDLVPISLIDFCFLYRGQSVGTALQQSVQFAQQAEQLGYHRIWYTEHHNMPHIISSSPAVLIAHVAAKTEQIRLGSGGVMLPNHSPYTIAEQFGTLAELHPNRIDLGVGRAPGTDMNTLGRALRRDPHSADRFPDDVEELRNYLSGTSSIPGVRAIPGENTHVPIYILGSSMFGASLAAAQGLPYAFASHFAPTHLKQAASYYRNNFKLIDETCRPYLIAAVNIVAADTDEAAEQQFEQVKRKRVRAMAGRGRHLTDSQLDALIQSHVGQQIIGMLQYTAVGTPDRVRDYLLEFQEYAGADELMVAIQAPSFAETLAAMKLLSQTWG